MVRDFVNSVEIDRVTDPLGPDDSLARWCSESGFRTRPRRRGFAAASRIPRGAARRLGSACRSGKCERAAARFGTFCGIRRLWNVHHAGRLAGAASARLGGRRRGRSRCSPSSMTRLARARGPGSRPAANTAAAGRSTTSRRTGRVLGAACGSVEIASKAQRRRARQKIDGHDLSRPETRIILRIRLDRRYPARYDARRDSDAYHEK